MKPFFFIKSLQWKFFILTIFIALLPLGVASYNAIIITRDELKTSVNEKLNFTVKTLVEDIDESIGNWLNSISIVSNALESSQMNQQEKQSLLQGMVLRYEDVYILSLIFTFLFRFFPHFFSPGVLHLK